VVRLAVRLPPGEDLSLLVRMVRAFRDPDLLAALAEGLAERAGRLRTREAARLCAEAVPPLLEAMRNQRAAGPAGALAPAVASLAPNLGPSVAARVCREAVGHLAEVREEPAKGGFAAGGDRHALWVEGLAALAAWLPPSEEATLLEQAVEAA